MKLTSHGAAGEVTGSCHLIELKDGDRMRRVLLDCGLIQGRREDELRNHDPFPFDPASLDAVVLSHAHIDHSGRLPMLVKQGFRGRIHTQHASADLVEILLKDSASLNARDVERRNRKRERNGKKLLEPLYADKDVAQTLKQLSPEPYEKPFEPCAGVTVRLHDAGHILGSAIVELELKEGSEVRTLVFSGDLGHRGSPILRDFKPLKHADFVLLESTYGDREHRSWDDTLAEVGEVADVIAKKKGNVLIPAFSVGRSQMIMYAFARNREAWQLDRRHIFLDSPMAIKATKAYVEHTNLYDEAAAAFWREKGQLLALPNLHFTESPQESMAINQVTDGAVIIAGSGMCTGGRILHHLKHNLWRRDAHVIIAGYQGRGTLGRKLVEGKPRVRIHRDRIRVAASIHTIGGLSAHAGQNGLVDWYTAFENRPPVLLVHGEPRAMKVLRKRLESETGASVRAAQAGRSTDLLSSKPFGG